MNTQLLDMKNVLGLLVTFGVPISVNTVFADVNPVLTGISLLVGIAVGVTVICRNVMLMKKK